MPGGMVLQNLNGLRFLKGFLYATGYAGDGVTAGTTDQLSHGALQDISINHSYGMAKLHGPESLAPLGVGLTEENLTFTAKFGVIHQGHFSRYIGGTSVFAGGITTLTKYVNDEPQKVDMHLKTPSDGSDLQIYLYGCVIETCNIISGGANRAFHIGDIAGQAYGEGSTNTSKLFSITMPGNLTLSS